MQMLMLAFCSTSTEFTINLWSPFYDPMTAHVHLLGGTLHWLSIRPCNTTWGPFARVIPAVSVKWTPPQPCTPIASPGLLTLGIEPGAARWNAPPSTTGPPTPAILLSLQRQTMVCPVLHFCKKPVGTRQFLKDKSVTEKNENRKEATQQRQLQQTLKETVFGVAVKLEKSCAISPPRMLLTFKTVLNDQSLWLFPHDDWNVHDFLFSSHVLFSLLANIGFLAFFDLWQCI